MELNGLPENAGKITWINNLESGLPEPTYSNFTISTEGKCEDDERQYFRTTINTVQMHILSKMYIELQKDESDLTKLQNLANIYKTLLY